MTKNQGVKRKQTRISCPRTNNVDQDVQGENEQNARALIVASPPVMQFSLEHQSVADFELDEKLGDISRKLKKTKVPNDDISAAAAMQPRREP